MLHVVSDFQGFHKYSSYTSFPVTSLAEADFQEPRRTAVLASSKSGAGCSAACLSGRRHNAEALSLPEGGASSATPGGRGHRPPIVQPKRLWRHWLAALLAAFEDAAISAGKEDVADAGVAKTALARAKATIVAVMIFVAVLVIELSIG